MEEGVGGLGGGDEAGGDLLAQVGQGLTDGRVGIEVALEHFLDEGEHPFDILLAAAGFDAAAGGEEGVEVADHGPGFGDAFAGEGGGEADLGFPAGGGGGEAVEGGGVFGAGAFGGGAAFAIGFVDDDGVGEFDDAFFDALEFVSGVGGEEEEEEIGHGADGGLALAGADGFDDDGVEAEGFAEEDGLAGFAGDAAEGAAGGGGADEGGGVGGEFFHAGFIAEDAAAGAGGGGVDGEDGGAEAGVDEVEAEGLDEGGFTDAGDAGDAEAEGAAGAGEEGGEEVGSGLLVFGGVGLDEGDGAGEDRAVSGEDAVHHLLNGKHKDGLPQRTQSAQGWR